MSVWFIWSHLMSQPAKLVLMEMWFRPTELKLYAGFNKWIKSISIWRRFYRTIWYLELFMKPNLQITRAFLKLLRNVVSCVDNTGYRDISGWYISKLTMDCGWRSNGEIPQSVLEARVWVIWRCWWRRWGYKVGEGDPLGEGVQTHGVKVAGSQSLRVVGAGIEGLGQLVQGAVEGGFENTGSTHARGQTESVDDLLWAGVWQQLTPERGGKKCYF